MARRTRPAISHNTESRVRRRNRLTKAKEHSATQRLGSRTKARMASPSLTTTRRYFVVFPSGSVTLKTLAAIRLNGDFPASGCQDAIQDQSHR